MNQKPKLYLVFKLIGIVAIIILIFGIIKLINGFGDFESNNFLIGMFIIPIGTIIGIPCLIIGFGPEIKKMSIKTAKYIQEENKEELKDITLTSAEIMSGAVTTTAQAVKEGLRGTMFCKYCGKEIDTDSQFCKHCGKTV